MTFIRGCGAVPDLLADAESDGRNRHVAGLIGANPSYPPALEHTHLLDKVQDQGNTNSCVGQFVSSAVYLAGQTAGRVVPRPSAKWAYDLARYFDTPGMLVDLGCRPRSMMLATSRYGLVSAKTLALTEENVNEAPPFDADLSAADARLTGYYKLEGNVPMLLRMALSAGHFPGFAMTVHDSFFNMSGAEVYDEPDGIERGRHMVTCIGYRPGAVLILNSWGRTWASHGFAWLSDRFVASQYVSDRYVITSAPAIR